jgi:hypothetical protein
MAPAARLCQNAIVPDDPMPHDVFLSYASSDRAAADAVCAALEARGIRCWIAPRDVPAGADWGEAILTAIGRAHAMVLVLSRQTASSVHVRNEVVTAVSQSLALVPVRIEDCQPGGALRLHLAGSHWLNVFPPPIESHADALAAGVRLALAADATIEIPRGQAAALVAAARAQAGLPPAPAGAAGPVAQPAPAAQPSVVAAARAAAAALRPAPAGAGAAVAPGGKPGAKARDVAATVPAPHLPTQRRGLGLVLAAAGFLVAALGAMAWYFTPQLKALLGAGPAGVSVAAAPEASPPGASASLSAEAAPRDSPAVPGLPPPGSWPPPFAAAPPVAAPPAVAVPPASAPRGFAQAPAPHPAPARLMNGASETISRLYVARVEDGIGQEDWLGQAQITPGNAVLLRPPPGQGCLFNIRVVYVGGRAEDRPGVDLCAASELRFEGTKGVAGAPSR